MVNFGAEAQRAVMSMCEDVFRAFPGLVVDFDLPTSNMGNFSRFWKEMFRFFLLSSR